MYCIWCIMSNKTFPLCLKLPCAKLYLEQLPYFYMDISPGGAQILPFTSLKKKNPDRNPYPCLCQTLNIPAVVCLSHLVRSEQCRLMHHGNVAAEK